MIFLNIYVMINELSAKEKGIEMDFKVSTCFYEQDDGGIFNYVDFENLKALGFTPSLIKGGAQNILEYML